jgi:hypothetical protein
VTPEERAARERKQKIFLVVGGLFLVALLAFQLPKLLGGSSSPEAAATTATTEPGQASPIASATSTATAANAANGIVTPPSGSSSVPRTAKLTSFTVFRPKDPFVQQVKTGIPITGGPASEAPAKTGAKGEKPTTFSTGGAKVQSATIVVVNGVRQVLEPGTKFPASDPLFVLVAEKPGSKSVVIGIAGGAYSGGGKTTKLKVGKPLTLVNTATGARYKISLVSVGSGEAPDAGATNATGAGN